MSAIIMPTLDRTTRHDIVWDGQRDPNRRMRRWWGRAEREQDDMGQGKCAWAAGTILSAVLVLTSGSPATAQQLSERSVQTLMNYAYNYTPDKFTPPNGKTVFIDKKKPKTVVVPVNKAREIIMAGRLTAHAQICDQPEDQVRNYHSLMLREQQSKKWSPQQLVFINQLHLTTVMMLVGKLQIVTKDGKKTVSVKPGKSKARTCTAEQKEKVRELVEAYVKSGPDITRPIKGKATKTGSVPAKDGKKN